MPARLLIIGVLAFGSLGCVTWKHNTIATTELPPELHASKVKSMKLMRLASLGAPSPTAYRLQPGDLVDVTVPDLLAESQTDPIPARVQEDGTIIIPHVGAVPVANLTVNESEQSIAHACVEREIMRQPSVIVAVRETKKAKVNVLGAIQKPGQYEFDGNEADLLRALVAAGGLTEDADTVVRVHRRDPARAANEPEQILPAAYSEEEGGTVPGDVLPNESEALHIDLASDEVEQVIAEGVFLQNGDVVTVEERKEKPVYVVGMVNKPGEYKLPHNYEMRVLDAIGLAGGVDRLTMPDKCIVTRPRSGQNDTIAIRIDLDVAKRDLRENLTLMPGDIVSVEETAASFTRGIIRGAFRIGIGTSLAPSLAY